MEKSIGNVVSKISNVKTGVLKCSQPKRLPSTAGASFTEQYVWNEGCQNSQNSISGPSAGTIPCIANSQVQYAKEVCQVNNTTFSDLSQAYPKYQSGVGLRFSEETRLHIHTKKSCQDTFSAAFDVC